MIKVSLITPTFGRQHFLPLLAQCVAAQSHKNIEWLVLDDSPEPIKLEAPGLTYIHSRERMSIGAKRNALATRATGEIIMHFDDDDYYGPEYVARTLQSLEAQKADLLLLSGFLVADLRYSAYGWFLPALKQGFAHAFTPEGPRPLDLGRQNLPFIHLCFGFGYAYRKSLWAENPFPDQDAFEDRAFTRRAMERFSVKAREDVALDTIHTVHGKSTSNSLPQFLIPEFMVARQCPIGFAHLARLRQAALSAPQQD